MASDEDGRKDVLLDRRTMLKGTAAAGFFGAGVTGSASAAEWHEITFCASGSGTFGYWVQFDGAVKRGGTYQSDSYDTVGSDYVEGAVSAGRCDSFLFQGSVVDHELTGAGTVKIDGKVVEDATGGGDQREREITFCAAGSDVFSYRFQAAGGVRRGGTYQSDSYDTVGSTFAKGAVAEGRCDSFLATGRLSNFTVSGPGTVKVDGEVVEDTSKMAPDDDGDADGLPNLVVVSAPGATDFLEYQFRVTGELVYLEPNEDSGQAVDEVIDLGANGTRVIGAVRSGDDRYAYSGQLIRENIPEGVQLDVSRR